MGGIGPMFGQYLHFADYAPETLPYAIERYTREAERLLGVFDKRLAGPRIRGRHLLDCRYGDLPLDSPAH